MTVLIIVFNLICWGAGILNCLVLLKVIKHRNVLKAPQLTNDAKEAMRNFQDEVSRAMVDKQLYGTGKVQAPNFELVRPAYGLGQVLTYLGVPLGNHTKEELIGIIEKEFKDKTEEEAVEQTRRENLFKGIRAARSRG